MVAERGSVGEESPSTSKDTKSKRREIPAKPQKPKVTRPKNKNKQKLMRELFGASPISTNAIRAPVNSVLVDDLRVSSSDEDCISLEPFESKNLSFEIDNDLCETKHNQTTKHSRIAQSRHYKQRSVRQQASRETDFDQTSGTKRTQEFQFHEKYQLCRNKIEIENRRATSTRCINTLQSQFRPKSKSK